MANDGHKSKSLSPKNKPGRPSVYSQALVDRICNEIADGKSLRAICDEQGMPARETVRQWLADPGKKEFTAQYARAHEEQADTYADEITAIADAARDGESAQVARVRIDARKWVASKLKPKKYGDAMSLSGELAIPPVILHIKRSGDG